MSDYTWVTITVLENDFNQHKAYFDELGFESTDIDNKTHAGFSLITLNFSDCKWGKVDIGTYLADHRIAYDYDFGNGDEWDGGEIYGRLTSGGLFIVKQFSDGERNWVDLDKLLTAQKAGTLDQFIADTVDEKGILSWESHIENKQTLSLK